MVTRSDLRVIFQTLVAPLRWRIDSMVRRAIVRSVSSDGPATTATVQPHAGPAGEVHEEVEVAEPYGFTSRAPDGSEAVLLCEGGDTGHPIVLAVGDATVRLRGLGTGEVAMYVGNATDTGARVVLRADGNIELQPGPTGKVQIGPQPAAAAAPAVTRVGDSISLSLDEVAVVNAFVNVWNGLQPAGGAFVVPGGVTLDAFTGRGTITDGGTGAVST